MKAEYTLAIPRGWRRLRLGEVIRKGDRMVDAESHEARWYVTGSAGKRYTASWRRGNGVYIRREGRAS